MLYTYITNQQMHIYKYVQLQNIILHQHVSTTLMTIDSVSYNNNTIGIQITVQNHSLLHLIFSSKSYVLKIYYVYILVNIK